MITNGFTGECVSAKVIYSEGIFDYNINKIFDIHAEKRYFKNTDHYILSFIEEIKENVIKNLKNLNFVTIHLLTYDANNILHRFIVSISNLIKDFLKQKHTICFKKSIFVVVQYESKIVFTGSVDFKGLV